MARRKNKGKPAGKPTLLTEATVTKFMKLANLEDLSGEFRRDMGYKNNGPERYWEQPGLSKYRSNLLREQDEEEMDAELPPEEVATDDALPAEEPAAGGGAEAQVEEIVAAIADAIEEVVPEVSVDVTAGGEAEAGAPIEEPMDADAGPPVVDEPVPGDEEAALRETISKAIREALLQREEMEGGNENPSALVGPGSSDQLAEEDEEGGGPSADSPEVEAVVDAIVDALEATTDMEVEAEPSTEEAPADEAPADEEAAMRAMMEALKNRKTARKLIERVMKRASRESKGKKTISESTRRKVRQAVRKNIKASKASKPRPTRRRR
jgi:hypothetical protein